MASSTSKPPSKPVHARKISFVAMSDHTLFPGGCQGMATYLPFPAIRVIFEIGARYKLRGQKRQPKVTLEIS